MFLASAVKLNQKYQIKDAYVHCSSLLYLRLDATFYFVEIEINALIELSFYRLLFVSSRHGRSTLRSAPRLARGIMLLPACADNCSIYRCFAYVDPSSLNRFPLKLRLEIPRVFRFLYQNALSQC